MQVQRLGIQGLKKELSKVFELQRKVDRLTDEWAQAEAVANKITPTYSDGSHAPLPDISARIDVWIDVLDLEYRLICAENALETAKAVFSILFSTVRKRRLRELLEARYVFLKDWRTIAEEEMKPRLAVEYVRGELHDEALREVIRCSGQFEL